MLVIKNKCSKCGKVFLTLGHESTFLPCFHCGCIVKELRVEENTMMKEQYIWYYNQAKSKLYSMSNEDIESFIQQKLAEVDAARHTIRERSGKIEVLPPLDESNLTTSIKRMEKKDPKKAKKLASINFDQLLGEIMEEIEESSE